jgi:hypothetical protein
MPGNKSTGSMNKTDEEIMNSSEKEELDNSFLSILLPHFPKNQIRMSYFTKKIK